MKLFGTRKKKEETAKAVQSSSAVGARADGAVRTLKDVIVRPRVTEKAANLTSYNVYTFDVRTSATKGEVKNAVKSLYTVTPVKVRVVNSPAKKVQLRKRRGFGVKSGVRKAYVYLKKGDSIALS